MTNAAAPVPPAHGGKLTDQVIEAAIAALDRAAEGTLTDADGALVLVTAGPAMKELLQWRRRVELIADLAQGNVMMFPGARG
jgi:hypothetical protein